MGRGDWRVFIHGPIFHSFQSPDEICSSFISFSFPLTMKRFIFGDDIWFVIMSHKIFSHEEKRFSNYASLLAESLPTLNLPDTFECTSSEFRSLITYGNHRSYSCCDMSIYILYAFGELLRRMEMLRMQLRIRYKPTQDHISYIYKTVYQEFGFCSLYFGKSHTHLLLLRYQAVCVFWYTVYTRAENACRISLSLLIQCFPGKNFLRVLVYFL